jgi:uncharacterized iron-regulated protein
MSKAAAFREAQAKSVYEVEQVLSYIAMLEEGVDALKVERARLAEHIARGKGSIARALYRESTTLARALEQMEVSIVARRAALAKKIAEDPFLEATFNQ